MHCCHFLISFLDTSRFFLYKHKKTSKQVLTNTQRSHLLTNLAIGQEKILIALAVSAWWVKMKPPGCCQHKSVNSHMQVAWSVCHVMDHKVICRAEQTLCMCPPFFSSKKTSAFLGLRKTKLSLRNTKPNFAYECQKWKQSTK